MSLKRVAFPTARSIPGLLAGKQRSKPLVFLMLGAAWTGYSIGNLIAQHSSGEVQLFAPASIRTPAGILG